MVWGQEGVPQHFQIGRRGFYLVGDIGNQFLETLFFFFHTAAAVLHHLIKAQDPVPKPG